LITLAAKDTAQTSLFEMCEANLKLDKEKKFEFTTNKQLMIKKEIELRET
jgi:hypothetical protein